MHLHLPSSAHARHKIVLGFPTPGGISMSFETARALYRGTQRHDLALLVSVGSWDGFNSLWANALNLAAAGEATHFAMLHADVAPQEGWLDILADELDRKSAIERVRAVLNALPENSVWRWSWHSFAD